MSIETMRCRRLASLAAFVVAVCLAIPTLPAVAADGAMGVMTYNVYQGTELDNSLAATTPLQFALGAAQDFLMMRQTKFAERAQAIAAEIDATRPALIGLQEVALWRTRFPSNPTLPATTVESDFLQVLLDALSARGLHYTAVSSVNNFDLQGPALFSFGLMDVRLTDRNVILAPADLSEPRLKLKNPQAANFRTNLVVPTFSGQVTVLEGWTSIDVETRRGSFRFITTHLDAFAPPVRLAQASEILSGPANTDLPVVMVGDTNTTTATPTYTAFINAGFADVWAQTRPGEPGFTCCQELPTIRNPVSRLSERIDLVLVRGRGALEAEEIQLVGARPIDRTPSGLWPSDHAGLVAQLELKGRSD